MLLKKNVAASIPPLLSTTNNLGPLFLFVLPLQQALI
jgi:hypothetical protein